MRHDLLPRLTPASSGSDDASVTRGEGMSPLSGMAWIPGGTFLMGSDRHYAEEAPAHRVQVDGFWMEKFAVSHLGFRCVVRKR